MSGRDALRRFVQQVFEHQAPERRRFRSDLLTDERRVTWEYPRKSPDGDQMDIVEVMEIEQGLIRGHRVYADGRARLTGVLTYDDVQRGARPGILLVHGGAGLDGHARAQARRYATLGHTVLAADMFGEGVAGDRERVMVCYATIRER